jgi:serine protease Do
VVRVNRRARARARSRANLGQQREGSGIVIDERGTILTVGYVVVEAQSVEITTYADQTARAVLTGYDHATGLAVLKASEPLAGVVPLSLGSADALALHDPVVLLPHGGRPSASIGYVMSKRKFTASWEYLLESALFVSPPTRQWAGAALLNREGQLVGIGSLLVRPVSAEHAVPGNMFVPVDAVKPILAELIAHGRRAGPALPWLGLGTEELQGHLMVTSVTADGPAERAGIRRGDIVVALGSEPLKTQEDLYRRMWALGPAGTDVPLRVLQDAQLRDLRVRSIDRNASLMERPGK